MAPSCVTAPLGLCRATTRESALSAIVSLLSQFRYDDCAFRWVRPPVQLPTAGECGST